MTTIVTRAGKGASLSWTEADANFTNLNTYKLEEADLADRVYTVQTQNPQAAKWLSQDGSFKDTLQVRTGVLSASAASTLTDNSFYNAWPVAARMKNGQILVGYTQADNHHADTSGKCVGRIGTEGNDGSITWGAQFDIYDDPSLFATIYGLGFSNTGRVFATLWRDDPATSGSGEAGLVYSDDNGATWSSWIDLNTPSGFTQESYGAGPVVQLPDGSLIVSVEGSDSGDPVLNRSSKVLFSTDEGVTWGNPVTVRAYVTDSRPYYETKLVLLPNGNLLAIHRTSDGAGTHYISLSTDSGATWAAPYAAFSGYGAPSTILTSTGALIATTRNNATGAVSAFTSIDWGVTWGAAVQIGAATTTNYACPVELLDGRIFFVLSEENSSTDADIDYVVASETTLDLRDVGTRRPQNSQSAAYTTVLSDQGKHILHPIADNNPRTFTIDSNANVPYPIGTELTFVNLINTLTIAITSDTMYLAGAGSTGNRTLAAYGVATALKVGSTTWIISGTGLT